MVDGVLLALDEAGGSFCLVWGDHDGHGEGVDDFVCFAGVLGVDVWQRGHVTSPVLMVLVTVWLGIPQAAMLSGLYPHRE